MTSKMAMKTTASLQQEKAKMMLMSVILRRNQVRRKEGRGPSAWVVKSFDSILSLMKKDSLVILQTEVTRESP